MTDHVLNTKAARSVIGSMNSIRVMLPRHQQAFAVFDELRMGKLSAPFDEQPFVSAFGPSHAGKSMTIKMYCESVIAKELIAAKEFPADMDRTEIARRQKKVLHVTLSSSSTEATLATDILTALGDPRSTRGTRRELEKRVFDALRDLGVQLLVVDEIQHLSHFTYRDPDGRYARDNVLASTGVTDALKKLMISGAVPMVFVGIEEARGHLFNDQQLANRCVEELRVGGFDYSDEDERLGFVSFCGKLGAQLEKLGMFSKANLLAGDIPACLHATSGGRIGVVARVVTDAARFVKVQTGGSALEREHLEKAVDRWAIPRNIIDYNPFSDGLRSTKVRRR